jgi:hypothetical protein
MGFILYPGMQERRQNMQEARQSPQWAGYSPCLIPSLNKENPMKKICLASLFLALPAYAHVPYVEGLDFQEDAVFAVQPPIEKSLALYSSFHNADDQDRVIFTLSEADFKDAKAVVDAAGRPGRKVTFNTIVPACAPYASVLPSVALIGPQQDGLPQLAADAELPFTVAEDQGVYALSNTEQGPVIKENITATRYFEQKTGSYEIIVWEPEGRIADYVLVVGDEEIFGVADIMQSLKRIGYLRAGREIKDEKCRQELKP